MSAPAVAPPGDAPVRRPAAIPRGLVPGRVVAGTYELVRRIGRGAMGEVWAARHTSLDDEVAIKLVLRHVDHHDGTSAESRFLLEARLLSQLSRKTRHIVAVTDHGHDGALGYLVMELLEGESLEHVIERAGPLALAQVAPIVTQIARGLAIAHADGVVHRDLKPSNIFVTLDEDGRAIVKVLDFGMAKLRRGAGKSVAHETQRGFLLGTPAYMSPEQARGKAVDHRADVWALAVLAFAMLTAQYPFDGESGQELFARIVRATPESIQTYLPDAPPVLADFFARAFAADIEDRFQSALALAGAFEQLDPLASGAPLSLPPSPALGMLEPDFDAAGLEMDSRERARARARRDDTLAEPSIIAAGVPRRRKKTLAAVVAALLLLGVLLSTVVVLGVYFERDPSRTVSLRSGEGTATLPPPVKTGDVPPPDPAAAEVSSAQALASASPSASALALASPPSSGTLSPPAPRAASRGTQPAAQGNARTREGLAEVPAFPTANPSRVRVVDKAEVF